MARDADLIRIQAYYPILLLTLTINRLSSLRVMFNPVETGLSWLLDPRFPRCPFGVVAFGSLRSTARLGEALWLGWWLLWLASALGSLTLRGGAFPLWRLSRKLWV
jgi:hypothetical protein